MEKKYSEIEIETAKNALEAGYKWVARDLSGRLYAYEIKPKKGTGQWELVDNGDPILTDKERSYIQTVIAPYTRYAVRIFANFTPLFPQIRWEDEEPVRLRDIVPQILTDEERSYIQTVIAPFREQINFVKVYYGNYYGKFIFFSVDVPEKYRVTCGPDTGYSMFIAEDSFLGMKENREYSLEELEV